MYQTGIRRALDRLWMRWRRELNASRMGRAQASRLLDQGNRSSDAFLMTHHLFCRNAASASVGTGTPRAAKAPVICCKGLNRLMISWSRVEPRACREQGHPLPIGRLHTRSVHLVGRCCVAASSEPEIGLPSRSVSKIDLRRASASRRGIPDW